RALLSSAFPDSLRGKRDRAMVSILLGCGLRRAEAATLTVADLQVRENHWAIADLLGKGKRIRTVPVPRWTKAALDKCITGSLISDGIVFRRINKNGKIWGNGITTKTV